MNVAYKKSRIPFFTRQKRQVSLWNEIKSNKENYFMMAPFMILFAVFTVLPVLIALPVSFTHFNMIEMPKWVGFSNYIRLFLEDDIFLIAVRNTLTMAFLTGPLSYFACLIMAWLINQMGPRIRTLLTFVFYIPSITGNVFYYIWLLLFSGDQYGMINALLLKIGIINDPIQWLTNAEYTMAIVIIVSIWLSLGAGFLAFIAGLQSIDISMYESGAIDGIKNRWQELWFITLPSMGPQLMFGAVMQISASFAAGTVAQNITGFPSTDYSTHTVVLHAQDYGSLRFEMGYASAISFVLFASVLVTNTIIRKIIKKFSGD